MSRPTSTYTNENGGTVQVHKVTEEGTVLGVDGRGIAVKPGDLVAQQGNPNCWEPISEADLSEYKADEKDVTSDDVSASESSVNDFDPSEHRATEVRAYLSDRADAGDRANYDRVVAAEQEGHNRKSAYTEW